MSEEKTAPPATAGTPWFSPLDEESRGFIQNRGWDKLGAPEAAEAAIRAYREASKRLGAPADEIVRFPKDPNSPEWAEVHRRLGKPDAPESYDFSALSPADKPADPALVQSLREAAFRANLAPHQASTVAEALLKHQAAQAEAAGKAQAFQAQEEQVKLEAKWGPKDSPQYQQNLDLAQRAVERLGIPAEAAAALHNAVGGAALRETLRALAVQMGEARYITGGPAANREIMSADQAASRLSELKNDQAFVERWSNGDVEAKHEMDKLSRMIVRARMAQQGG